MLASNRTARMWDKYAEVFEALEEGYNEFQADQAANPHLRSVFDVSYSHGSAVIASLRRAGFRIVRIPKRKED